MNNTDNIITLSIVIPIYRGEHCISDLLEEIKPFTTISFTTKGLRYCVTEVILVHDCGPDNSAIILQGLKEKNTFTQVIWLARNYGQHPATLAGLASSSAEWVITMDEDGQQDPKDVANLLDYAVTNNLSLVYADPLNPPPHGLFRNVCSFIAKKIGSFFLEEGFTAKNFNSFRLIYGENARVIAAYCGYGIYLDIALRWVTNQIGYCPVTLREERRPSSYSLKSLVAHFWRMVITSGTRPLRFIAVLGLASLFISLLIELILYKTILLN